MKHRVTLAVAGAAALLALGWSPRTASAQTKVGEAVAARLAGTEVAKVVLGSGEMSEASVGQVGSGGLVSGLATAVTTGAQGVPGATSIATLSNVNLLSGIVTAGGVVAMATSYAGGADATGSGFEGLRVMGLPLAVGDAVAPNTRITLPGIGFVVLNEQIQGAGTITVNMIRLVQEATLLTPRREYVVASAKSGP